MTLTKIVFAERLHTNGFEMIGHFEKLWKVTNELNNKEARVYKIDPETILKQFINTYFPQKVNTEYDSAIKLNEERFKVLQNKDSFINYIEDQIAQIPLHDDIDTMVIVTGIYDDDIVKYLEDKHKFKVKYLTTSEEERIINFNKEFSKQNIDRTYEDITSYIDLMDLNGETIVNFNQELYKPIELNHTTSLDKIALQLVLEIIV